MNYINFEDKETREIIQRHAENENELNEAEARCKEDPNNEELDRIRTEKHKKWMGYVEEHKNILLAHN